MASLSKQAYTATSSQPVHLGASLCGDGQGVSAHSHFCELPGFRGVIIAAAVAHWFTEAERLPSVLRHPRLCPNFRQLRNGNF